MTIDDLTKIGYQLKLNKVYTTLLYEDALKDFGPDHRITEHLKEHVAEVEEAIKIFDELREKLLEGGEADAK